MLDALEGIAGPDLHVETGTNKPPAPRRGRTDMEVRKGARRCQGYRPGMAKRHLSLSHVALPFAPGDPVYGAEPSTPSPGVHLGNLAWRGEKGVLKASPTALLRLRWKPFYPI